VTFLVETQKVRCHKTILSLRSDHFYAMFTNSFKESRMQEVELHDISMGTFLAALQFIYTGHIDITDIDSALALYEFAGSGDSNHSQFF
jgi:hypothetical protein